MKTKRQPRLVRRAVAPAALLVMSLVALTACVPLFPDSAPNAEQVSQDPAVVEGTPAELKEFYTQKVSWTSCERNMRCAKVKVPMDYAKPQGQSIELAVVKLPASSTRKGSLLLNPGGPGSSGYDMVADSSSLFSSKLRGAFDLVGFDPRGVKRSAPVKCLSDSAMDAERQKSYDLDTDSGVTDYEAQNKADIAECVKNTGPVLGFVDTVSSVKDMDILRAILNQRKLDYLGFSYGTKLGASYADQFPDKVGKFVLDGAMDPTLTVETLGMGQAKAFEAALKSWAENCVQSADCPFRGSADEAVQQIRTLNESYEKTPQKTRDGRLLTGAGFSSGLSLAMYSTDLWDVLQKALTDAMNGDPNGMMSLADYAADRDPNSGKYNSNSAFAFTAINCLDYQMSTDITALRTESKALQAASPTFGKYLGYSGLGCKDWPYQSKVTPHPITAKGTGPIVVIGTTRDPATPYEWAEALSKQLSAGVLVSWDGDGHTAYGRSNACVGNAVDSYFVDDKTPQDGLKC
ncbi:alpha/beta hydrolase [Psychromicrobium lacuslunae]|uniref:Alpha/beta hydrolase n=1 Tax=Psychromicrobium lacuslunae TaxID=1618207 RepID=A0A0D4C1Y8_9MICC|nr:alpha/beta hydrolase [Psychromicrobium lacuslunae]AJT42593.1 alpha/beta hydrolase [Psychromicrobium lacuslunae]